VADAQSFISGGYNEFDATSGHGRRLASYDIEREKFLVFFSLNLDGTNIMSVEISVNEGSFARLKPRTSELVPGNVPDYAALDLGDIDNYTIIGSRVASGAVSPEMSNFGLDTQIWILDDVKPDDLPQHVEIHAKATFRDSTSTEITVAVGIPVVHFGESTGRYRDSADDVRSVTIMYRGDRVVTDLTIEIGEHIPLHVRIEPLGIEMSEITWFTSNRDVFEVVQRRPNDTTAVAITGLSVGTATLVVKVGEVEAECIIRVRG